MSLEAVQESLSDRGIEGIEHKIHRWTCRKFAGQRITPYEFDLAGISRAAKRTDISRRDVMQVSREFDTDHPKKWEAGRQKQNLAFSRSNINETEFRKVDAGGANRPREFPRPKRSVHRIRGHPLSFGETGGRKRNFPRGFGTISNIKNAVAKSFKSGLQAKRPPFQDPRYIVNHISALRAEMFAFVPPGSFLDYGLFDNRKRNGC
jgi:hypothetical protein